MMLQQENYKETVWMTLNNCNYYYLSIIVQPNLLLSSVQL